MAKTPDWRYTYGRRPAPGAATRQVGLRAVTRYADDREVAAQGDWLVVVRDAKSSQGWIAVKVFYLRPAVKNVYGFGVHAATARVSAAHDAKVLAAHNADVQQWAVDVVLADHKPELGLGAPRLTDYASVQRNANPGEPSAAKALAAMVDAFAAGKPWTQSPRMAAEGRYAVACMMEFGMTRSAAKALLDRWLAAGVVANEMYDRKAKKTGLRVLGMPTQEGGK